MSTNIKPEELPRRPRLGRQRLDRLFVVFCIGAASLSVVILVVLLSSILWRGAGRLSWEFLTAGPGPDPKKVGIWPAAWGTLWVCSVCAAFTFPVGIGTAILLEEFRPRSRWMRRVHSLIQLNIGNLAGVPSVVYGILGLTAFVAMFGLAGSEKAPGVEVGVQYFDQFLTEGGRAVLVPVSSRNAPSTEVTPGLKAQSGGFLVRINVVAASASLPEDPKLLASTLREGTEPGRIDRKSWYYFQLPLGRGVAAGALTLMLVVLPTVIISAQEALRAVPNSLREAAFGLGATPWQMVWSVSLPASIPGIMTGSILALSRAIGEAAPILIICGVVYIPTAPRHLMDSFTVLPLQIYNWAGRPQEDFYSAAAAGIIVLLAILLTFNAVAIVIRQKVHRPLS